MMDASLFQHLPDGQKQQVMLAEERVLQGNQDVKDIEAFADLLEEVGLHEESRKRYQELLSKVDMLSIVRCWRKICLSYSNQRDFINAELAGEKGLQESKGLSLQSDVEMEEYFNLLAELSLAFYFRNKPEKLENIVTKLKKIIPHITGPSQRLRFFFTVSLGMLIKYRWYNLPEEAVSHSQFYVHLATQAGNQDIITQAKAGLAFVHLWREELVISREIFAETISMLNDKNYGTLLMCYHYTALGYRMQDNLSMTEQWTNLTLHKSEQTSNQIYKALSYGNLAWIYAKRKNWLYAEDYARKGVNLLRKGHPLYYTCVFPLIQCLVNSNKREEAGQYVYFLLCPLSKKLPDSVTAQLKKTAEAWIKETNETLSVLLDDLITEAKITGYY